MVAVLVMEARQATLPACMQARAGTSLVSCVRVRCLLLRRVPPGQRAASLPPPQAREPIHLRATESMALPLQGPQPASATHARVGLLRACYMYIENSTTDPG